MANSTIPNGAAVHLVPPMSEAVILGVERVTITSDNRVTVHYLNGDRITATVPHVEYSTEDETNPDAWPFSRVVSAAEVFASQEDLIQAAYRRLDSAINH